ncbi:glucosidase II [Scheffersomyces coipomensis]|uniref:glucosidase II n=1 Tax=Scheffersomyces coipomensis TaxID=1788519 RepID=UPI00315DDA3D
MIGGLHKQFLLLLLWGSLVVAVKDYLFKTCETAGFCHRNKYFAESVKNQGHNFIPKYSISQSSISIDEVLNSKVIHGNIIKFIPSGNHITLPFEISLLDGNNLRFKVDEKDRTSIDTTKLNINTHRYNETSDWAFVSAELPYLANDKFTIDLKNDVLIITYGDAKQYRAIVDFWPIKLTIYHKDKIQIIANDKNLFNFEHWRLQDENSHHLTEEETDYDMFEDHFKDSKEDSIPLGPESIGLDFTFKNFQHLYGIPEHADSMNLKDTTESSMPYRLFNVDIFEYETDSRLPMYGAIPFILASKPEISVGLFWINSADTFINVDKTTNQKDSSTHWISENGIVDFIITIDKTPADINRNYGLITGYTQLPPLFSLGYHQCRWNYNDEKDVLEVNSLMDEYQIPYDTIWLDIEYTDQKKYFTWHKEKFPNPERMLDELDHTGRNLVIIIDPHIKTGYYLSDELTKKKSCINDASNNSYHGHCWPGESVWIDTLNPTAQEIWDAQFTWNNYFLGGQSSNIFIWNDMNEPSVFNGPETSAPKDDIHFGGWEHRSVHNIYGMTYHEATYNSLAKRNEGHTTRERPFVLTRSYYAGSQRTAAMWTGDNMCKWEYLQISIPMVLTSNIVGMPFSGADVGGFFGDPSTELLTRWYQTGIWYPFFRAHAHIDSRRREPWLAGEPYTSIIRDAVRLRYSILSVIYTAFYESSQTGIPVMKPIFYESLSNIESYSIEDQFFVGNSGILVKPVTEEDAKEIKVYLPDNEVYYDYTDRSLSKINAYSSDKPGYLTKSVTLEDIPVFIKGGSIISLKDRYRRSSRLMFKDPYTLIIALNKDGEANGSLYVDDGESFDYEKHEEYAYIKFNYSNGKISADVNEVKDRFKDSISDVKIEKIIILNESTTGTVESIIIHNPKLSISQSWTGKIEFVVEHDEL